MTTEVAVTLIKNALSQEVLSTIACTRSNPDGSLINFTIEDLLSLILTNDQELSNALSMAIIKKHSRHR